MNAIMKPVISYEPALFESADQAVRFAMTRMGSPRRPASSRMVDATGSKGTMTPVEAAAQAGMIMNVVEGAGRLAVAILIATTAPRMMPCSCGRPCCSGRAINREWHQALDLIAHEARPHAKTSYALRSLCVMKIYESGQSTTLVQIAKELNMDVDTVSKHYRAIQAWLKGVKAGKKCEPIEGIETRVWGEAESALRDAGIVGLI